MAPIMANKAAVAIALIAIVFDFILPSTMVPWRIYTTGNFVTHYILHQR
jgi:hypothetical protein